MHITAHREKILSIARPGAGPKDMMPILGVQYEEQETRQESRVRLLE